MVHKLCSTIGKGDRLSGERGLGRGKMFGIEILGKKIGCCPTINKMLTACPEMVPWRIRGSTVRGAMFEVLVFRWGSRGWTHAYQRG